MGSSGAFLSGVQEMGTPSPTEAGAIGALPPQAHAIHHPEEALGQLLQLRGPRIGAPREEPGPREMTPCLRADGSPSRGHFRVAVPGPPRSQVYLCAGWTAAWRGREERRRLCRKQAE